MSTVLGTDAATRLRRQSLSDFVTLSALWGSSFLFMRLAADELGALPTAGLRVGLAALLTQDPPLLLLDEPVSHLDLHHQVTVLEHLRRLAHERGRACLMSIHDLNLAARFCTHALVIGPGAKLHQGPAESTMNEVVLSAAFGHPVAAERFGERTVFVAD